MKIAYVCGAYRAPTRKEVELNITKAREVALVLVRRGIMAYCPHTNTKDWDLDGISNKDILLGDFEILSRCDFVVMVPGWLESVGSNMERCIASSLKIPIYDTVEEAIEKECS